MLLNSNSVYTVKDSLLKLVKVNPIYFNEETVIVKGLEDGAKVLSKPVPGAYTGMKVKINQ